MADTVGLGPTVRKNVEVQVLSPALDLLGNRLKAGRRFLVPPIQVRILVPQLLWPHGPAWSGRCPVTAEIEGSNPSGVAIRKCETEAAYPSRGGSFSMRALVVGEWSNGKTTVSGTV